MTRKMRAVVWTAALLTSGIAAGAPAQQAQMSFFVTSVGIGKGADLGGLKARTAIASSSRNPSGPAIIGGGPI